MWALGGRHLQELHVLPQRLRWVLSSSGALINQRGFSSLRHRRGAYARAALPPRPGTDGHFLPLPRPGTGTRVPGTDGTLKPPAPEARRPSALCQAPSRLSGAGAGGPRAGQRLGAGARARSTARLGSARGSGRPGRGSPWRRRRCRAGMAARCLQRAAPRAPLPAPPSSRAGGWGGGWRETRSDPCRIQPLRRRPAGSVSARLVGDKAAG